jgi:hypothetical protein
MEKAAGGAKKMNINITDDRSVFIANTAIASIDAVLTKILAGILEAQKAFQP